MSGDGQQWSAVDIGTGLPLVLLHGIGDSCHAWDPVLALLSRERRVIAFDLPGFGQTPPLPNSAVTPADFASLLPAQLAKLGIDGPVAMAGNSLGGWIALEAAKQGHATAVAALCPAGLWGSQRSWWGRNSVRIAHRAA